MPILTRRELLTWFAVTPTLPHFLVQSAAAFSPQDAAAPGSPIIIVVRMLGGNDALNTVVPFRDDRYYKARPTIALPASSLIQLPGRDLALNPWLTDVRRLIDDGHAGIVQGVGYPRSSRSHLRSTEIWETGSLADPAPEQGWLGRYLDHACECGTDSTAGIQFGETIGRTLATATGRSKSIGNPALLLQMDDSRISAVAARGSTPSRLDYLRQVENSLAEASRTLRSATRGTGSMHDYPNTPYGQSLRWAGDMIETGSPTRAYYVTIGSFDTPDAASFDTHIDEVPKHKVLFSELGQGFRAFRDHMKRTGQFDRVLVVTFSDFGRQLPENRTAGTEHGDASVLFYLGGRVQPGLVGQPFDLGRVKDGGLEATVDFRQVYTDVLQRWLRVDAASILGERLTPFPIISA